MKSSASVGKSDADQDDNLSAQQFLMTSAQTRLSSALATGYLASRYTALVLCFDMLGEVVQVSNIHSRRCQQGRRSHGQDPSEGLPEEEATLGFHNFDVLTFC